MPACGDRKEKICRQKGYEEYYENELVDIYEEELTKESTHIEWDVEAAEKGGYEHFMLKEVYEQPKAVADTLNPRLKDGKVVIEELNMTDEEIKAIKKIMIVACGSA